MRRYETGTQVHIKTKPIFIKYVGKVSYDQDALYQWESEKGVLLRIWNGNNFSKTSRWIPKSKIIKMELI